VNELSGDLFSRVLALRYVKEETSKPTTWAAAECDHSGDYGDEGEKRVCAAVIETEDDRDQGYRTAEHVPCKRTVARMNGASRSHSWAFPSESLSAPL
jgi:hypothetical protein